MTAHQLRTALDRLDITQVGAAKLLRVDPRTMRRWVAGDAMIPEPVAFLLKLMLAAKIDPKDITSL